MNEQTHFFIKIYLTHFILERVDVGWVWEVSWRRGQTATYWPQVLLTMAALLSHSGKAAQPCVTEGSSPLYGAGSHSAGILSPTDLSRLCPDYIFVWRPPASAYLHRCISWLTARSRVNMLHIGSRRHQTSRVFFLKSTLVECERLSKLISAAEISSK